MTGSHVSVENISLHVISITTCETEGLPSVIRRKRRYITFHTCNKPVCYSPQLFSVLHMEEKNFWAIFKDCLFLFLFIFLPFLCHYCFSCFAFFFIGLFPKPEGTEVETTYNSVLCASGKSHLFSKTFFAEIGTKDKGGIKGLWVLHSEKKGIGIW